MKKEYQQHEQLEAINGYVNGSLSEEKAFDAVRDMQPSQWRSMYTFENMLSTKLIAICEDGSEYHIANWQVRKANGNTSRLWSAINKYNYFGREIVKIVDLEGNDVPFCINVDEQIEKYNSRIKSCQLFIENEKKNQEMVAKKYWEYPHYVDKCNMLSQQDIAKWQEEIDKCNERIKNTLIINK